MAFFNQHHQFRPAPSPSWNPFDGGGSNDRGDRDNNDIGHNRRESGGGGESQYSYAHNHNPMGMIMMINSTEPPRRNSGASTMKARRVFRDAMRRETIDHRRIVPGKESTLSLARNIVQVLQDRELRGSQAVIRWRLPPAHHVADVVADPLGITMMNKKKERLSNLNRNGKRHLPAATLASLPVILGDRSSPLTVFDSPISTTSPTFEYDHHHHSSSATNHHHHSNRSLMPPAVGSIDTPPTSTCIPTTTTTTSCQRVRSICYPMTVLREIQSFAEHCSALKYQSAFLHHLGGEDVLDDEGNRPTSSSAVSTISIAFAPNALTMASTHGDHSIKISCCNSGLLLQSLEGHPRTPWTVKYHPTRSEILASGCLGHQVRVWNWPEKISLYMVRLEFAIISLSFHPSGQVLAVANGTRLHFWGIPDMEDKHPPERGSATTTTLPPTSTTTTSATSTTTTLTEMDQRHMLRCVHFPPDGKTIVIGGVNPSSDDSRRRGRGSAFGNPGMSFYLRMWDFDLARALHPHNDNDDDAAANSVSIARRPINNPKTFIPRALLYNDGGFDVSPDGKTLCACAEYWLPDGVDNAMELLQKEEVLYGANMEDELLPAAQQESLPPSPLPEEVPAVAVASASAEPVEDSCDPNRTLTLEQLSTTATETKIAVNAALSRLQGYSRELDNYNATTNSNSASAMNSSSYLRSTLRSPSFRDSMELSRNLTAPPRTPTESSPLETADESQHPPALDFIPHTPPNPAPFQRRNPLSPPSPPGRRFASGLGRAREMIFLSETNNASIRNNGFSSDSLSETRGFSTPPQPPPAPPVPPPAPVGSSTRPPHPLSVVSRTGACPDLKGRYVPHVVMVSLDMDPIPDAALAKQSIQGSQSIGAVADGFRPRLGQILEAYPLDPNKASAVTCVKFSPSTDFCLIGYGVREPLLAEGGGNFHPVTALYRIRGGMTQVSTMLSGDDDVNIARFHPDSGYGFVYGTKQGRVRLLSPRPWNYYNC